MLSLIILKYGHSIWSKRKLKRLENAKKHILALNKRKKRHSFYVNMKRERGVMKRRKTVIKNSIYSKIIKRNKVAQR